MTQLAGPPVPEALLSDLRSLARRHGSVALVRGCALFVAEYAVKGMTSDLAEKKGEKGPKCPTCRARQALLDDTKAALRLPTSEKEEGAEE